MIPIYAWSRLHAIIKPATHLNLASGIFYPGADHTPICYAKRLALDHLTNMMLHWFETNRVAGIVALLVYLSATTQGMRR